MEPELVTSRNEAPLSAGRHSLRLLVRLSRNPYLSTYYRHSAEIFFIKIQNLQLQVTPVLQTQNAEDGCRGIEEIGCIDFGYGE